jgi:NADH:ubiquinone oxidoreductase subunit F (NADH-binding)/(2Fe-2S) ferredoxin
MPRLTMKDLDGIAEARKTTSYRFRLMLCAGTGCVSNRSLEVKTAIENEIRKRGLTDQLEVVPTGCNGFCERGPILVVQPGDIFYQQLSAKDVPHLVEEHFLKGRPVAKLMYTAPGDKQPTPAMADIPFFKKQFLIALRNRGMINPEKIEDYIARDGYRALIKALTEMTPERIISEVSLSGLRGRGGAGFPTGVKWQLVRNASGANGGGKYVVCNGDEGDPGAFMDRSILEADPHAVIEGMVIGAKAVGAGDGFVYVRNEYPLAVQRLSIALDQARDGGLLGEDILGTGFHFDIRIKRGAGAFVCGEETALIASIEGRLGEPRPRPPYPAQSGLWGRPTCINNVETWANIPAIISRGSNWFAGIGTETSKGTKVFSLVGKINNTGLVEVPMGITLREIVYDIGGGISGGKAFKAVQTGGPSGGCIPKEKIDLTIDYESLTEAGSMMGSGGMVIMDEDTCMVDVARYFLSFTQDESCGKCTPCREGTKAMLEILTRITEGKGTPDDIGLLERLASSIKDTALCGLGKTAPNPVLTTLRYFRGEYEAHIVNKKCPAHVCRQLNAYTIDTGLCLEKGRGCDLCRRNCGSDAISGRKNEAHVIDQAKCIKCGVCFDVCNFGAVRVE